MTTPFWCLLVALLIPIVLALSGAGLRLRLFGREFDNNYPRQQAAKLEGVGARLVAAQQNAWEAATVFTGATIVAHIAGADPAASATAAMVFIGARLAHAAFYIANVGVLRTLSFLVATISWVRLFQLAADA